MTALSGASPTGTPRSGIPRSGTSRSGAEPAARFRDLVAAEWLKFASLRSTRWGAAVSALAVVALNANAAYADYRNWPTYPAQVRAEFVPDWAMNDAFNDGSTLILILAASALGALMIVSDYASGLARTTFAAVPARRSVVAAKATVLTAVMVVYGAVVAGTSFAVTQAILSGRGVGISLGYPGALRAVAASALLAPVCALVGLGIGAVVRHPAAGIVAAVVVLLLVPALLNERRRLTADLLHAMPRGAWSRLDGLSVMQRLPYQASVPGSWLVYAAWSLAGVLVAVLVVHRRDL
jgi:ABC-2 type transport system permease protein